MMFKKSLLHFRMPYHGIPLETIRKYKNLLGDGGSRLELSEDRST